MAIQKFGLFRFPAFESQVTGRFSGEELRMLPNRMSIVEGDITKLAVDAIRQPA